MASCLGVLLMLAALILALVTYLKHIFIPTVPF